MSENHVELKLQPPRSYNQKRRLAKRMRAKSLNSKAIKQVVWHPENSPAKGQR